MNRLAIVVVVLALLVGVAFGYLIRPKQHSNLVPAASTTAATPQRQVLYWYDPMHPDQHFDKPGRSPFMDMDLVPKYADAGSVGGGEGVRIDPRMVQNLGVRTVAAERGSLTVPFIVAGTVAFDASTIAVVQARANGFVERVRLRKPLMAVRRGDVLADIVAPEWNAALAEYQALHKLPDASLTGLRSAARSRLLALGVPEGAIAQVERSSSLPRRIALVAPRDGVLASISAREGQAIAPGMELFTINGLDDVWIDAAVPEAQVGPLRAGLPVSVDVPAWPGRVFDGRIAAVLPQVDAATRTLSVRIVLPNADRALAPGMFARVRIDGASARPQVLVPSEAVIATGTRSVVLVEEEPGRFLPHEVRTGAQADGRTAILDGLDAGARVVVSGQFLIDSEANLRGSLRRLGADESADHSQMDHSQMNHAPAAPAMDHSQMDHSKMNHAPAAPATDHSQMDHSQMNHAPAAPAMDHSQMDHSQMNHAPAAPAMDHSQMDHSKMNHAPAAPATDHSQMDHSKMNHAPAAPAMDHSQVDPAQPKAAAPAVPPKTEPAPGHRHQPEPPR